MSEGARCLASAGKDNEILPTEPIVQPVNNPRLRRSPVLMQDQSPGIEPNRQFKFLPLPYPGLPCRNPLVFQSAAADIETPFAWWSKDGLNLALSHSILDLSKVPATTGGQSSTLSSTDPVTVTHWVQSAPAWSDDEKRAVTNFVFNYMALLGLRDFVEKKGELNHLVKDWEIELKKLGIEINPLQANEWVILDHF